VQNRNTDSLVTYQASADAVSRCVNPAHTRASGCSAQPRASGHNILASDVTRLLMLRCPAAQTRAGVSPVESKSPTLGSKWSQSKSPTLLGSYLVFSGLRFKLDFLMCHRSSGDRALQECNLSTEPARGLRMHPSARSQMGRADFPKTMTSQAMVQSEKLIVSFRPAGRCCRPRRPNVLDCGASDNCGR
jgi:hypothetical protein